MCADELAHLSVINFGKLCNDEKAKINLDKPRFGLDK